LTLCGTPEITANKSVASGPTQQADGTSNVTFLIEAENTGTQQVDNVSLQDDLDAAFGAGNFTIINSTIDAAPTGFAATIPAGFNGVSDIDLLTTGGTLQPNETVSILLQLNIDAPSGSFTNVATAGGDDALTGAPVPPSDDSVNVAIATIIPDGIIATKSTPVDAAPLGAVVPYTITFENTSGVPVTNLDLVDLMPHGFSYVEGSAVVNGVPLEPSLVDWNLVWPNQSLAPGETITITHIIGRVFDDLDKDGYHDDGEPGLGGVRVVSVNGLLITTDEFGRYHVACDVIPADRIGSNYILKLDDRTLPTGYSVTSENPRVVRVTQGKLAKINFAATRLRTINLELNDASFKGDSKNLTRSALTDIGKVLPILEEERSVLKLNYQSQGQKSRLQRARIESVKALIKKAWKSRKRPYKLDVETDVK